MGDKEPQKPLPTTLDPKKMIEDMAKQQLEFGQKAESKEAKAGIEAKKAELMAEAAKARADIVAAQPVTPEAPKQAAPEAGKPAEAKAPEAPAQPASTPADTTPPAETPPTKNKGMFGAILDKIQTFYEKISKKFTTWLGNLFGIENTDNPAETGQSSPDKPIEGPDSTAGLSGKQLAEHPQFKARAEQIAKKIHVSLSDLYAIFNLESGIDPKAINKTSGASGLIQWMPNYAPKGTTIEDIRKMTGLQQLEYVDKHFSAQADKIHRFADLYAVVFWPAAVGKPADYIFGSPNMEYAKQVAIQNAGIARFSHRQDKLIDKAAFDRFANSKRPADSALVA